MRPQQVASLKLWRSDAQMSEMGAKAECYYGNMGIIRGYGMLKRAPLEQRPAIKLYLLGILCPI